VFDHVSRALVNRVGCIAVSVEHHLAPEHKFPVPLEDCYDALVWTAGHIANYGGDPARALVETSPPRWPCWPVTGAVRGWPTRCWSTRRWVTRPSTGRPSGRWPAVTD
jgi:hypothetical protein